MKQEQIEDAIRIVLFLSIIHRPATVHEITMAVNLPRSRIIPILYRLKAAHIISLAAYRRKYYKLQDQINPITLEEIAQAMERRRKNYIFRHHRIKRRA